MAFDSRLIAINALKDFRWRERQTQLLASFREHGIIWLTATDAYELNGEATEEGLYHLVSEASPMRLKSIKVKPVTQVS